MPDIFISHSDQDRDLAQRIASFFEGQGRSVSWHDQRARSEPSSDAISALRDAKAIIAIWSKSSLSSPYVLQHAIAARDTRRLVHVVRGVQPKQVPFQKDGPLFDETDLLQISLALLPYCRSR